MNHNNDLPVSQPLLKVSHLTKSYKDFQLKDVSFTLPTGMIMGFLGKNGAGKSTTIKAIMDLINPDGGQIDILGMPMPEKGVEIKEYVGYVGDIPLLNQRWTVERTIQFSRQFYRKWDAEGVKALLNRFNLTPSKKVSQLSKGMKVKLSLLLALAHKPKLLLLDEPTSGLDPVAREEVLELLFDFVQDESCGVLFSSHITTDVEKLADWVTMIDDGEVFVSEDKETLLDRYRRIIMTGQANMTAYPLLFNGKQTRSGFVGYTDDYDVFKKLAVGDWHAERLTLEELFVLLAGQKGA
ncbi:ABC transporter ATP-binding protein [Camelliibacillus cellulosilyticus]|uniref:ABC transporter ATP-binding protein n=1 Tax=Camelliibacillus cellulosilyticus TaxID=2174486 RepID=A0ABV9GS58_9BACL